MRKKIFVTGTYIAFHNWEEAPREVSFLRHVHRHVFFYRVEVEVKHNDREIEFFTLKSKIEEYIDNMHKVDVGSCELQAENLLDYIQGLYNWRYVCVSISEDNENGAVVSSD